MAANYVAFPELRPPLTALVASGGHTVILDIADYTHMEVLGTTRDDAAGEAFDKIARVLGLPYPGARPWTAWPGRGRQPLSSAPRPHPRSSL